MRKTLLWIMTAALLLAGCGSSNAPASDSAQPQEETTEAVEETLETVEETEEAVEETSETVEETEEVVEETSETVEETEEAAEETAETEAEVDESEFLPQDKVDEILEKAEVMEKRMGDFVSSSGLDESDQYSYFPLVNYVNDVYTFAIPFIWLVEDDAIWLELGVDHGAMAMVQSQDMSEYGTLTEESAERALQSYENKDADYFANAFGMEEADISSFERIEILGDQKAAAVSFEGIRDGVNVECIMVVGTDLVNNRLIIIELLQTLNCEKSHFNDFKTFLGTMTY